VKSGRGKRDDGEKRGEGRKGRQLEDRVVDWKGERKERTSW